jgi:hypothetical protein
MPPDLRLDGLHLDDSPIGLIDPPLITMKNNADTSTQNVAFLYHHGSLLADRGSFGETVDLCYNSRGSKVKDQKCT